MAAIGSLADKLGYAYRNLQCIPLRIDWSAGAPSVALNPANASITLTDNGTGDVTVTLGDAGEAPIMAVGTVVNATTCYAAIAAAATSSAVQVQIKTDAGVATDPTSLMLVIFKLDVA